MAEPVIPFQPQPTAPRGPGGFGAPGLQLTFYHLTTARRAQVTLERTATLASATARIWQELDLPLGGGTPQYVMSGVILDQGLPLEALVPDGAVIEVYSNHEGA